MTNKQKFAVLMGYLSLAFEKGDLSEERVELYWRYLGDIPVEALGHAVHRIIRERKYASMPSVAEIREAALGTGDDGLEARALEAWSAANSFLVSGLDCQDAALNEAVRLAFGGWRGFGESDPGNGYDQKRFLEAYKVAARKAAEEGRLVEGRETRQIEGGKP